MVLLFNTHAFGQSEKEPVAIGELGPAVSTDLKGGGTSFGYGAAMEATPIEDVLEVELGFSQTYAAHARGSDIDFLFKKPWTLSHEVEFMLGAGPDWSHDNEDGVTKNSISGELALDFMFWPFKHRQFGLYLEPAYDYGFSSGHEQSIGISGGLLIPIP